MAVPGDGTENNKDPRSNSNKTGLLRNRRTKGKPENKGTVRGQKQAGKIKNKLKSPRSKHNYETMQNREQD